MRPRWMIWAYIAVILMVACLVMSFWHGWFFIVALVIYLILTQGWRLFKPKDAE